MRQLVAVIDKGQRNAGEPDLADGSKLRCDVTWRADQRIGGGAPRAAELVRATRIFQLAPSLGGVESLICIPSIMTHGSMPREEKEELGVTEDLIRVSSGIEEIDDLIADLDHAFTATAVLSRA